MNRHHLSVALGAAAAATVLVAAPAHAAAPADTVVQPIPLGFHVKEVHLIKGGEAKMTFTWGCDIGSYSFNVELEQRPPVSTGYVRYGGERAFEGTCDFTGRTYQVTVIPSTISDPGARLVRGAAAESLQGVRDSNQFLTTDAVPITKKKHHH